MVIAIQPTTKNGRTSSTAVSKRDRCALSSGFVSAFICFYESVSFSRVSQTGIEFLK